MYINSNQISIYPSSQRSDAIDRNSKMPTERNITGLINNTTNESFIVSGLEIVNNYLTSGIACLYGYTFFINTASGINLDNASLKVSGNPYICFQIKLSKNNINAIKEYNTLIAWANDGLIDSSEQFTGLQLIALNESDAFNAKKVDGDDNLIITFPIAYLSGATFNNLYRNNDTQEPLNKFRTNASDIKVSNIQTTMSNLNLPNSSNPLSSQSLENYLSNNLFIDGGEIV